MKAESIPLNRPLSPVFTGVVRSLTLAYLAVPMAIFAAYWLRPVYAALVIVAVTFFLTAATRDALKDPSGNEPLRLLDVIFLALLAFLWVRYAGAGGHGIQPWDWQKHNSILKDLFSRETPVAYVTLDEGVTPLVYYLAYYMPAMLIGRAFGWETANHAIHAWTVLGAFFTVFWFTRLATPRRVWAGAFVFIFFGGMDYLGYRLYQGQWPGVGRENLSWWSYLWQYPCNTTALYWAPQHALSAWLGALLIADEAARGARARDGFVIVVLVGLWSPFSALGLGVVALTASLRAGWRSSLTPRLGAGVLCALVLYFYYGSHGRQVMRGGIFDFATAEDVFPSLVVFWVLQFGIYAALCRDYRIMDGETPLWFWLSAASLAVIPFYKLGYYNDFCMRVSAPFLAIFCLVVARNAARFPWDTASRALVFLLVLGSASAVSQLSAAVLGYKVEIPRLDRTETIFRFQSEWTVQQYVGQSDAFFFRHLARPLPKAPKRSEAPPSASRWIAIEAESGGYRNEAGLVRADKRARGGEVVSEIFGRSAFRSLSYTFTTTAALSQREMTVFYATEDTSAEPIVRLDGRVVARRRWAPTGSVLNLGFVRLPVGELAAGQHTLSIEYAGAGMAVDAMLIHTAAEGPVFIEAETINNPTRHEHREGRFDASGGMILDREFGAVRGDRAAYDVVFPRDIANAILVVHAATEKNGGALLARIDGRDVGSIAVPATGGWFEFRPSRISLGAIPAGAHRLELESNGVNVNLDFMTIFDAESHSGICLAADHLNPLRGEFLMRSPFASGGGLIAGDFGASTRDSLVYAIDAVGDVSSLRLALRYSSEAAGATAGIEWNGRPVGELSLPATGDPWVFEEAAISIPVNGPGPHRLTIRGRGTPFNLDSVRWGRP